ncbi:phosphatidylinositol-specific phospholipase C domain-containing protein [Streptomyces sp. NPDC101132]|uniref:phosphatidylinositol-specific phospholipase C domain-containing protein n=1 Tax=Streptomyces sp. NPDC101132 TaxID=3366110 RepID=UPI003804BE4C
MPRPGTLRRTRTLRQLALTALSFLFLAAALTAPAPAAAADSKYGAARFDQWSWVTTHNAYANTAVVPGPRAQSRSISDQLRSGVRGLMLDTYDITVNTETQDSDVLLCHTEFLCYSWFEKDLETIVDFLKANPTEVVTLFLENYASRETLTKKIADVLNAKGAGNMLFSPGAYNITGRNWPLLSRMVADNRRLVVFQDRWADDVPVGSGALMYTWAHTVETRYSYDGRPAGCERRGQSQAVNQNPMPNKGVLTPLFTMNQFNSNDVVPGSKSDADNGINLKNRIDRDCRPAAGRNPNFVAVNYFESSDTPGVTPLSVVAELNRNAFVQEPHPAVWTVNSAKQYVGTTATNRCMVRGDTFSDGQGGLVTQRACANPAPSSQQWTAMPPQYDGKGYYWIRAGNGNCLTVPYNNGTPPGDGTQMFWWPCETRWSSGSQLWNVIPVNLLGGARGYYFINQWTGRCLTLDPGSTGATAGRVTQAACPAR